MTPSTTLPDEAKAIGEWSTRALAHLQEVVALTSTAAGLAIHNAILRARLAECQASAAEGADAEALGAERGQWQSAAEEALTALEVARARLTEREARLAELSAEWEEQAATIMRLERENQALRDAGAEPATAAPAPTVMMRPCKLCKKSFPVQGARKTCEDCRPPKKEADK